VGLARAVGYDGGMADQPSPRRFQFRLRTLMIVVTRLAVPCAYVGWQAKIVRERTAFRDDHCRFSWVGDYDEIPWLRRCLGDEPYEILAIPLDSSKDLRDQAASLFPDARIMADNPRAYNDSSINVREMRFPDDETSARE
jgi:hypothetical protein